jgi:phage baseplate assembly protein W
VSQSITVSGQANKYTVYADAANAFAPDPFTGDLLMVYNEQCVKQSVINIVRTMLYSRPYQPTIGSTVYNTLFEPNDQFAATSLQNSIQLAIENFETRAVVQSVTATSIPPRGMSVSVIFTTSTSSTPQTVNITVGRVR